MVFDLSRKNEFNPVLIERILRRTQQYAKTYERNKPIAKEWFNIAKDDISVSKLLIENKHHATSVYHLQQAFEKLSKCYFILSGRMEPEQAKGHQLVLNRLKKEIKDEYVNNFLELSKSINVKSVDVSSAEESLKVIEKTEDELRLIECSDIKRIISQMNHIETKLLNSHFIKATEKKLKQRKFRKGLRHIIFKITHFRTSYSQVEELIDTKQVKLYLISGVISIKLNFLSLMTYVHFNTPRYPSNKGSNVTYFNYTDSLGIVKATNLFIEIFNDICSYIDQEYFSKE